MATELGRRRAEIVTFLKGLSEREKLLVLAYLSHDAGICARAPNLANTVLDMRRSHNRLETIQLARAEASNLDLEFLARRKGCRLERVVGQADRWRIFPVHDRVARTNAEERYPKRFALSPGQALEALRALPDQDVSAKS
jgi:hypothetical protein